MTFLKHPDECKAFGIFNFDDVEDFVKRMYICDSWPLYLKLKENGMDKDRR